MTENWARYALAGDGSVRDWLSCGVLTTPLKELEAVMKPDSPSHGKGGRWILNYWAFEPDSTDLKMRVYRELPAFTWQPPQEHPTLHTEAFGKRWEYTHAHEDGMIDFSRFNFTPTQMQGWLFALLETDVAQTVQAELMTIGPARVWLNGALHTHYQDKFSYVAAQYIPLSLSLKAGLNAIYLQSTMLGWREARLALGLRLCHQPAVRVAIPLGAQDAAQWHRAQDALNHLRVPQFAFPSLTGELSLASDAPVSADVVVEVGMVIPESPWATLTHLDLPKSVSRITLNAGERAELVISEEVARAFSQLPGENTLTLTIRPADGTPIALHRDVWASSVAFSHAPYGTYDERLEEARQHLARMPYDVPTSMVAVELGTAEHISSNAVKVACHFMNNRYDCADFYAIGLLALMFRYGDHPALLPDDRAKIEEAFKNFKFWIDEPGIDAMCYFTENHQILFHVTQYLAGQRWGEWVFSNSGMTGKQHMTKARPRIENWILRRLKGNFSEWDSNAYMTLDAFAMLALVEFAGSARLREMAETLLHKIFFMIAAQSFRGAHGSTHGRCYVTGLKSSRVENTSSLQRIAWGMGILNGETRATGLLALAKRYRVPAVIQHIGADVDQTITTRARSVATFRPDYDFKRGKWDVSTLTRRTPETMLAAALNYEAGSMGIQEHLWQATLSPEAVVFTTYPGNSQEHGNARPNFWSGSARLPRVGMVGRTVVCLYRLEERVGMGFTHAYFPTAAFEEYALKGQWAFGRVGEAYVALWGDGALVLTDKGRDAQQELRSGGEGTVWLCVVGSHREDGDFATFIAKVMQRVPEKVGTGVRWQTLEGEQLAFFWEGAMTLDGQAQDWDDFPHYENAYTSTRTGSTLMHIRHNDQTLTLDLVRGRVF